MTKNQIAYQSHLEDVRANTAKEIETHRANLEKEKENIRSNLAKEAENLRSNKAMENIKTWENVIKGTDAILKNVPNLGSLGKAFVSFGNGDWLYK